ncbi:MAG: peptidoglycan-binding protein [Rhizobium sp.]|nr:peptidoglycan-binding protein [Rhizobium sp.]
MNGSRSNTPTYGGKSSLDQLNRTIEGLEARIQGLVSERKSPPSRPYQSSANPVDEIIERQRILGGTRDRVAAAMERAPRHEPEVRYQPEVRPQPEARQPAWVEPERAVQPQQQSAALNDIAATLVALRAELKQGLNTDTLALGLNEIRSDMRSLKSATANSHGGSDLVRDELARLGDSIDRLGSGNRMQGLQDVNELRADLEDLRNMTSGLAREDSIRHLEMRWDRAESKLAAMDPDLLKEELVQLAWRIDDMKSGLGALSAAPAVRALEDKLIALAGSIEVLGRNVEARGDLSGQFSGLDLRLDEISRAIAVSASQSSASTDSAAFQRLESRIAELTTHIDMLQAPDRGSDVAERIDALIQRIEELGNEDAAQKLEERIAQLSKLIERNFRETAHQPEYSSHLVDISRKIDGLAGPSDALMDRLEMLAHKLDDFEMPAEQAPVAMADLTAMSRLESRLADIAARLDESAAASATDPHALANLEKQIASLSGLLSQPNNAAAGPAADAFGGRMNAIEDYMAASDEFIVEAARQAAEAVVDAYSRSGMNSQGAGSADISAISGLAEDLRALEAHTRFSEERTADTFSALHQTLVQIAGRLDDIGQMPFAEPRAEREVYREPEPAQARMPRATQPDFASASITMDEEPVRMAPKNSRVDVLQDVEMLTEAATADIVADAAAELPPAARREKPASKSLIAGLAARLKPGKKEKAPARVNIDPTPALDAGDMLVSSEDGNLLMEPGSGVPDVKKIMEKVRAGQKAGAASGKTAPAGQADVIAAARRAAQAAAQEAGAQKFVQPGARGLDKTAPKATKESKSIFGAAGESRRPILLAAAAVLLVVMSYPLVSNLISSRHADQPVDQPRAIETVPADQNSAAEPVTETVPAMDGQLTDPANQASLDATPALPETAETPEKVETGAEKLMTPADNADNATTLQKTETIAPVEDKAAPLDSKDAPVDDKVSSVDGQRTQPDVKMATDATPTDTRAIPATEVELPAGLQPASLVEAAKKADPLAYFEIGSRYTDGRGGVKIDLDAASKWYQLSADKGFAPAEYRLASFYEKGTGVTRDLDKARSMYLSAAEKGNASAMHNLAVLYATGAAGTPDFNEAARWFKSAADLNIRDSQFNLAILYARGSGVQQDLTESYKWFAVAAKQGDQDAAQKRDEVANAMSADQLKDAKAKFDLWKPAELSDTANNPVVPDEWVAKSNTTATVDMKRAIRNIQAILNNNGFDAGKPDGEMGNKTVQAIKAFQKSVGQQQSGRIDDALVKELLKRNKKAS